MSQIGQEREKKGTSEKLIPFIQFVRAEAEKLSEKSTVLQLYQEEFLSAQHMVMEEKSKGVTGNVVRAGRGIGIMEVVTRCMESYANENSEDLEGAVKARVYRFLGRFSDYKKQYKKSEEYYQKGLVFFQDALAIEKRVNRLELLGFVSYSLLKQRKTGDGLFLALHTLKEFDESEDGIWLKGQDYYTWAVWKSGIEIRTAEHILHSKNSENITFAKEFLEDAETILQMPDGTKEVFRLRLDELEATKEAFQKLH